MNSTEVDIFTQEIIKNSLVAIGEEMFVALKRTSMSPIIYEVLDFGIGITDSKARLISQGSGIPGFIGTLDGAIADTIEKYNDDINPGDIFITNIPYSGGGTHLSDVTMCKPVFYDKKIICWTACKAHWTEVGGMDPGSFTTRSTEIYQEGIQFPLIKLFNSGEINQELVELISGNVRLPEMTVGDLWACASALKVGEKRFLTVIDKYGKEETIKSIDALLDHSEMIVRAKLDELPQGIYEASDVIDNDGLNNGPFNISVKVTIKSDQFIVDFTGSSAVAPGPINCSRSALNSAVREVFMGVVDPGIPATEGCFRVLQVICPENTLLTANRPAPTSAYFESMVTAADVIRKSLASVMPGKLIAGQMGSVCSFVMSGINQYNNEDFILVQPLVGGWGAGYNKDGERGQFCTGNGETANVPVEIQESRYGVHVESYRFHNLKGGAGHYRGGNGVLLEYRIISEGVEITTFFGRGKTPPWGINDGNPGTCNFAEIITKDKNVKTVTMASRVALQKHNLLKIYTATGGGWGDPSNRSSESIEKDLRDGYINEDQAISDYGYLSKRN